MENKLRSTFEKIKPNAILLENEPLSQHCTFKVGGPADLLIQALDELSLQAILKLTKKLEIPYILIGGGANIVPHDEGFRGLVIDTSKLQACRIDGPIVSAQAGIPISDLSAQAADAGLEGLDFIYAMPGSLGGAVYMNARCYDGEMSQILKKIRYLDEDFEFQELDSNPSLYSYKLSPFTNSTKIILFAELELKSGNKAALWERMESLKKDRESKGHFAAPCAGSVFKNNHDFGAPSGKILDELSVRGHKIGGAEVSNLHANIIINSGNARAQDIFELTHYLREKVLSAKGLSLEPEIIFLPSQ